MKKLGIVVAGLFSAMTVFAQDPAPEATPADAAPVEAAAPADSASTEAAFVESAPAEASADAAPAETAVTEKKPWLFYVGYDRAHINFQVSEPNPASVSTPSLQTRFGGSSFSSSFNRFRVGTRLLDFIGLEAHLGLKGDEGNEAGTVKMNRNYGLYVVPTGVLFDMVEIGAVLGYSKMDLERGNASESFQGVSYGLNTELPLRHFFDKMPDIRLGLGGIVYHQKNNARIYGTHLGLRYDFKI